MLAFWLGTVPSLLLAGSTAGEVARWIRRPLVRRVAGGLMILTGILSLAMPALMMHLAASGAHHH